MLTGPPPKFHGTRDILHPVPNEWFTGWHFFTVGHQVRPFYPAQLNLRRMSETRCAATRLGTQSSGGHRGVPS